VHPHFDIPGLIDAYGYWAVAIGSFLEGETVLALAGLAAYRGYLDFYLVCVVAGICGFLGDQVYFFLGRYRGARMLARFPNARDRAHKFDLLLARYHAPLIVCLRFMYGFRILGPVMLGMGRVPAWKFMLFNFIGAAMWAPLIAGIGYLFGNVLQAMLHDLKRVEIYAFGVVLVVGAGLFILHWYRTRHPAPPPPPN
jgi:membrane protein DedA with SNARE-associated domain